jgi:serine/threonine protein kinase/Tfp pilus assembly protein PilF
MKTGDWAKAKRIFGDAIKVAPSERLRFLDEACVDDADLRREVESLLVSFDDAESFMERPAAQDITGFNRAGSKKLEKGKRVGHYEIVRQIGAGGMGEVYLAQDKKLDRRVAIKILNEQFSRNEANLARFIREAKAASSLNHPNILIIHEIGESENSSFIVSEFIEGRTLRELVAASPMHLPDILDITIQIVSALTAAHEAYIVHRDIKPENVMVRPDGYVKLLDFGLAKLTEQKPVGLEETTIQQSQTGKGVILGTVNYMSPEQAKGEKVEARTDIFSLGVVLYEMIAGRTPFAGVSMSETLANLMTTEPLPLARYTSKVPDELQRIVSKMLRKHSDERYQTMKGLLADLKSLQKRLDFEAELVQRKSPEQIADKARPVFKPNEATEARTAMLPPATADAKDPLNPEIKTDDGQMLRDKPKPSRTLLVRLLLGLLLVALLGLGCWLYFKHSSLASSKSSPIESIAVMPFVNESSNADTEYLSDGMTETLISSLSQIPKLNVKARSSVFRYKGKEINAQTIGKELNVQAILTGRVIQRGQDLILYVELVEAATENSLWKQTYNKTMTNLVALQNDIARDVADKLKVKLSGADEQKLAKNFPESPEAYQLYLQGLYHWNKLSPSEIRKSLEYFQRAVDVDPNYALAFADEGRAYFSLAVNADAPSQEVLPRAREAAVRALKLDDTLASAHTTLGWVKFWFDWDWNGAEQEFLRALSLDPNLGDTHVAYANVLTFTGRHAEALYQSQRARELEPLNLRFNALEGQAFFYAGKYDEAIVRLQKTVELEPTFSLSHLFLSRVYVEKGMYLEAITEATKASDFSGGHSEAVAHIVYALAKSGKRREAQVALNELTKRAAEQRYVPPYSLALAYNGLGETDLAIDWLEKGFQQRDVRMAFLKVEPKWNNLRNNPRFQDLLRRVGFKETNK